MIDPRHPPPPVQLSPPRHLMPGAVVVLTVLAVSFLALLAWVTWPLTQPAPVLSGPLVEYDAYAMQAGLLSSVVPVALSTMVARDGETIYAATNVAYTEHRMGAVATEVRRDSLNNVDRLSTRVAILDLKLDNHVRLDHPTPYAGVAVAPPDGLPPYLGPRDGR